MYVNSNHRNVGDGKYKEREEVMFNKGQPGVVTKSGNLFKNFPIKYLTKEEVDDRRNRGVCYTCEKP